MEEPVRTLGHCQTHDLELYVGCACGGSGYLKARQACRAMASFRIEELQRMGWFTCPKCGGAEVGVSIYYRGLGYPRQLENWRMDGATQPYPVEGPNGH